MTRRTLAATLVVAVSTGASGCHTIEGAAAGLALPFVATSGCGDCCQVNGEALAGLFVLGAAIGAIAGAIEDIKDLCEWLDHSTASGAAWDSREGLALRVLQPLPAQARN